MTNYIFFPKQIAWKYGSKKIKVGIQLWNANKESKKLNFLALPAQKAIALHYYITKTKYIL